MKKKSKKYIGILIIAVLSYFSFIFFLYLVIDVWRPPILGTYGGCKWELEKDYNTSISNEQEAATLLNEYFTEIKADYRLRNIKAKEINVTENEFVYKDGTVKIDDSGRIFTFFCPV
jgi:hypothetical protein